MRSYRMALPCTPNTSRRTLQHALFDYVHNLFVTEMALFVL